MKPKLRRPDIVKPDPHRDYIREHCPSGPEGFIAEDLDLIVRRHGPKMGTDDTGQFALIEVKHESFTGIGESKRRTFRLIDKLLHASDPDGERYLGFYLLKHSHDGDEAWQPDDTVTFGGAAMTVAEYTAWLTGENVTHTIRPMEFR